jgi:hypothetical protein
LAQGFAPLHAAISTKQPAVIKRLMEKGADIHAENKVAAEELPLSHRASSHNPLHANYNFPSPHARL